MRKRRGVVAATLLGVLACAVPAAAQVPDVPTLPDVPDLPALPDPILPPLPEPPPPPSLLTDATDGGSSDGSSDAGAGGSTAASGGSGGSQARSTDASRDGARRTRFDRLPRRYEVLLERILRGRNVDANLRRLEHALASASPELRARILRLVRAEIASLRRGGVTPRDRRRIDRLRRVEALFAPAAGASAGDGVELARAWAGTVAPASLTGSHEAGTGSASSRGGPPPAAKEATPDSEGGGFPAFPTPGQIAIGTLVLLLMAGLLLLAGLAFGLAAVPGRAVPAGRLRHFVMTSRSNLAFTGLVALAATMAVLLVGALL